MKFRLMYEGLLESNGNATQKQQIRKFFHPQLKELWSCVPNLTSRAVTCVLGDGTSEVMPWPEYAMRNGYYPKMKDYNFIPIVDTKHGCSVSIDVLILWRKGNAPYTSGDIDGKLKTLFDGLRMPSNADELGDYSQPEQDENPFFTVLQDDRQITQLSVDTDLLVGPLVGEKHARRNDARALLTIGIHPIRRTPRNQYF